jgi:hypothetical protein
MMRGDDLPRIWACCDARQGNLAEISNMRHGVVRCWCRLASAQLKFAVFKHHLVGRGALAIDGEIGASAQLRDHPRAVASLADCHFGRQLRNAALVVTVDIFDFALAQIALARGGRS